MSKTISKMDKIRLDFFEYAHYWLDENAGVNMPSDTYHEQLAFDAAWKAHGEGEIRESYQSCARTGWYQGWTAWFADHDYGGDDALEEFEDESGYFAQLTDARVEIHRLEGEVSILRAKLQEKFEAAQTPILVAQVEALDKVMAALESYHDASNDSAKAEGVLEYLEAQKLKCKPFKIVIRSNSVGIYRNLSESRTAARWHDKWDITDASRRRVMRLVERAKPVWNLNHTTVVFVHDWKKAVEDV